MATVSGFESAGLENPPSGPSAAGAAGLRVLARLPDVTAASRRGWLAAARKLTRVLPDRRGVTIALSVGLALAVLLSVMEHRRRKARAVAKPAAEAPTEVSLPPLEMPQASMDSSARLEGTVESPHTASHTHAAIESSVR